MSDLQESGVVWPSPWKPALPGSARICDLPEPFPGRATHQLHRHIVQLFHATPSCPHTFSPRNLEHFTALCMPKAQGPKQGIFTLSALQCLSGPTALCHAAMPLARVSLEILEHRSFSMLFSSFHLFSSLFISFHSSLNSLETFSLETSQAFSLCLNNWTSRAVRKTCRRESGNNTSVVTVVA